VATDRLSVVALLHAAEGRTDVFQFVVDVQRQLAQADNQTQNTDRGDQNQFSRDNETSFVVLEGVDELEHVSVFRVVGAEVRRRVVGDENV